MIFGKLLNRAILKTPVGKLGAYPAQTFDGCPAIVVCVCTNSGHELSLVDVRYNETTGCIEIGVHEDKQLGCNYIKRTIE